MNCFSAKTEDKFLKSARKRISGRDADFTFRKAVQRNNAGKLDTSIYVHIPFCESLCPYCPYNRIPLDRDLLQIYLNALEKEIKAFAFENKAVKISSVYYGGGSPLLAGERLIGINDVIRQSFKNAGDFCIEANPNDIDENSVTLMKRAGFNSVSLGVQSFNDILLEKIGRKYDSKKAEDSLAELQKAKFGWLNADMLFALPGEDINDLRKDIGKIVSLKPDQITAYPLFTFPYTEIARFRKSTAVQSPPLLLRRKMYYEVYDSLMASGYERCSVWSFRRKNLHGRYSSVTRERYVGFGASSGSYYETCFDLNTFSVKEYVKSVEERGNATALSVKFTERMAKLYDFYWRVYDTEIPFERILDTVKYDSRKDLHVAPLTKILLFSGMAVKKNDRFILTRRGAMWVHFLQNLLSLRAISRVWGIAKRDAWPDFIRF